MAKKPAPVPPPFTHHVRLRWKERFPGRDLDAEFARSKKLSKKRQHDLARQIPVSHRLMVDRGGEFRVSSEQSPPAIFVIAPDKTVVTVYPLTKTPFTRY